MSEIKTLVPGDEAVLERFLVLHPDSSMFLRANLRRAGLASYGGAPYQGTYVATLENGEVTGVVAHYWNGMFALQAPSQAAELAREVAVRSGRRVTGLAGPQDQVDAARAALALADPPKKDGREDLFALDLAALAIPPSLASGAVVCRRPLAEEMPRLHRWRADYTIELMGAVDGPHLEREAREGVNLWHAESSLFVAVREGKLVAMTGFNSRMPEIVQVGGVFTPPEERGKAYARAAVAGSLLAAREQGARRAVLFTDGAAARRCYQALGFRRVGEYALVIF